MPWLKKYYKRILIALCSGIALLYALPFILYGLMPSTRHFMHGEAQFIPLCDSLTQGVKTDSAKAMALFNYVAKTCKQPAAGENPKYDFVDEVFEHKTASCDQQVWLLMSLLRVENINAQMVFLYGNDSISRHTVIDVKTTPGNYIMLDPFYNLYFLDGAGKHIASIGDIMKGFISPANRPIPPNYFDLYGTKYEFKYHSDNTLSTTKKIVRTLLYADYYIFGKVFTDVFTALQP